MRQAASARSPRVATTEMAHTHTRARGKPPSLTARISADLLPYPPPHPLAQIIAVVLILAVGVYVFSIWDVRWPVDSWLIRALTLDRYPWRPVPRHRPTWASRCCVLLGARSYRVLIGSVGPVRCRINVLGRRSPGISLCQRAGEGGLPGPALASAVDLPKQDPTPHCLARSLVATHTLSLSIFLFLFRPRPRSDCTSCRLRSTPSGPARRCRTSRRWPARIRAAGRTRGRSRCPRPGPSARGRSPDNRGLCRTGSWPTTRVRGRPTAPTADRFSDGARILSSGRTKKKTWSTY